MKNTIKLFGIIVLVTVIGFSMAGCKAKERSADTSPVSEAGSGTGGNAAQNTPSGPIAITLDDPGDIPFLHNDSRIQVGGLYEITVDTWFKQLSSTMLILGLKSDQNSADNFSISVESRIPDFKRGDPVRVVFSYKPDRLFAKQAFTNSTLISITAR
jgi:hypothetical protein